MKHHFQVIVLLSDRKKTVDSGDSNDKQWKFVFFLIGKYLVEAWGDD